MIEEGLTNFVMRAARAGRKPVVMTGVARNIDTDARTCDIEVDDELTLPGCRLNAVISSTEGGILIAPTDGSVVAFAAIADDYNNVIVVGYSDVDSLRVKTGDMSLAIEKDCVIFNDGDHTTVFGDTLKTQLEAMSRRIDGIINALNSAVPGSMDGGAALKASISASLSSIADKEDFTNIEDNRLKH